MTTTTITHVTPEEIVGALGEAHDAMEMCADDLLEKFDDPEAVWDGDPSDVARNALLRVIDALFWTARSAGVPVAFDRSKGAYVLDEKGDDR